MQHLSKDFLVDSEGQVQHVLNVIILHPLQALVELLIQKLQVTQVTRAKDSQEILLLTPCGWLTDIESLR